MASDSLPVTANLYESDASKPYILLFHQAGSSRGEYNEIASRLLKFGYNCLAVDLRSGNEINFVQNETARKAIELKKPHKHIDAQLDILAAIQWAYNRNGEKVILFGSSYSASLCLKLAKGNLKVKAVVAYSPGEYFYPEHNIEQEITDLDKPIFVTCTFLEFPYTQTLLSGVSPSCITFFKPTPEQTTHGAKILWQSDAQSNENWLALMMFFKSLKSR